jgi:sRNA-binding protein
MTTLSLNSIARRKVERRLGLTTAPSATAQSQNLSPEEARRWRRAGIKSFHARIAADWPVVFCAPDQEPRVVLAIGIDRAIAKRYPDVASRTRRLFLKEYTRRPAYLRLLISGASRIALDGSVAGHVSDDEAEHAAEQLQRRTGRVTPANECAS